jgi:hypothetical protein
VDTSIEHVSEKQLHDELCGIGAEREPEQLVFSEDYEYVRSILFVRLVVVRPARVRCLVKRRAVRNMWHRLRLVAIDGPSPKPAMSSFSRGNLYEAL